MTLTSLAEELMDVPEASRRMGVVPSAVIHYIHTGRLPAERIGQRWLIRRLDFDAFAATWRRSRRGRPAPPERRAAELRALCFVATNEGATVIDLAAATGESRRSALSRLQALDAEGLIRRATRREQTRPVRCYLTSAGRALYRRELNAINQPAPGPAPSTEVA